MATKVYLLSSLATVSRGVQTNDATGAAKWWRAYGTSTSANASSLTVECNDVPSAATREVAVAGSNWASQTMLYEWITPPVAAGVTVSGSISVQWYAWENLMGANAFCYCKVQKVSATDFALSDIGSVQDDAEVGTSAGVMTATISPTSTAMAKGDRFRITIGAYQDSGTFRCDVNAADAATTWVSFNETITFQTTDPTTQTLRLTETASDVSTADVDYKAWTGTT